MEKFYQIIAFFAILNGILADPLLSCWAPSTGIGYNGSLTNVQAVKYSTDYVYISGSSIPSYSIGPWIKNPNTPTDQKYTYKFRRTPVVRSTKQATGLGAIGLWSNGVAIYNGYDGLTYNNEGVWKRSAYYYEGGSFDKCGGHADSSGSYHNHVIPTCLFDSTDSTKHSPIIGWAFDGFPIYGPYGYSDPNDVNSAIKKIRSSYRTRTYTNNKRATLSNGTTASIVGPDVSSTYPSGCFLDDFEYVSGLGDLNEYNMRFTKTPDYPTGVYAYFATIDASNVPEYPFSIGPNYYGSPSISKVSSITESVYTYYSYA